MLLVLLLACSEPAPPAANPLYESLGIPADARKVLVVGQNAHLDIDWLRTTDEYYEAFVLPIFDEAANARASEPGFAYSVAEMDYLRRFVADRGTDAARIFTIVGGGVSSPDVLLPPGESLLRDYQQGITWARGQGARRPRTAWLPDSFGLGPTTPDVLAAADFDAVAFWRVDGHPDAPNFDASLADFDGFFEAPGSNAERLADEGVTDWIWEGPGGGKVHAHWMYGGYMFGDYLDFETIAFRLLGRPVGVRLEDPALVADNIATAIAILEARSPTDFLFAPIGGDFQYPKTTFPAHAAWWNEHRYPESGVWVHVGTFEDYAALVQTQADRLEVKRLDLTPYWMGFYASRPALKEDARLASSALASAEMIDVMRHAAGIPGGPDVDAHWWTIGRSNHHDWITGTSLDEVLAEEQIPEVRATRAAAEAAIALGVAASAAAIDAGEPAVVVIDVETAARRGWIEVAAPIPDTARSAWLTDGATEVPAQLQGDGIGAWVDGVDGVGWRTFGVVFSEVPSASGFAACVVAGVPASCEIADAVRISGDGWSAEVGPDGLSSWVVGGRERLATPGPRVVRYLDQGGMYGFGHEWGGTFAPFPEDRTAPTFTVRDGPVRATVTASWTIGDDPITATYTFYRADPAIEAAYTLATPRLRSTLVEVDLAIEGSARARMAVPVGVIDREAGTRMAPQFAPFEEWFALEDDLGSLTVVAPANPAVTWSEEGRVGLVLQRNAPTSMFEGDMTDDAPVTVRIRLDPAADDTPSRYATAAALWRPLRAAYTHGAGTEPPARTIAWTDGDARATAIVRRDDHTVLRLVRPEAGPEPVRVRLDWPGVATAVRTDATEGPDGAALDVDPSDMSLPLDAAVTTLRIR